MLELYLGGARSGKSRLAEQRAQQQAALHKIPLVYLATATAGDEEMATRIAHHLRRRTDNKQPWRTIEEPQALADALLALNNQPCCIVVDCLTLWISNLLLDPDPDKWPCERKKLLACLDVIKNPVIFVSNEVGQGIVAANPLSRRFVDESGFLHQKLASLCDRVIFAIAGLEQVIKEKNQ